MSKNVWIITTAAGQASPLVKMAQSVHGAVHAVAVGGKALADEVAAFGAESVQWCEVGEEDVAEAFAVSIADTLADAGADIVLVADTPTSRALAGVAAAKLGAAVASGVTAVTEEGNMVAFDHLILEGKGVERKRTASAFVGVIADGMDDAIEAAAPTVIQRMGTASAQGMQALAVHEAGGGAANLATAERVVGAGRGLTSKDQLAIIDDLADALGAEVCCSLSLCDDYRWFDHSRVVGTSTQRIAPRIYVACGISGQPQHMAGVRAAKTIIAINRDPDAPIFKECDFGIVGDFKQVVPELAQAIRQS